MNTQQSSGDSVPHLFFRRPRLPAPVRMVRDPDSADCQARALREALAREQVLLREKSILIQEQENLRRESDHRLLNGLQMVVSLLSLQSRAAPTSDLAAQLSTAANRVAAIERIHRCLHKHDGATTVAFKTYLEELCCDFSGITGAQDGPKQVFRVEGTEVPLPAATAIPLGFIVNELITNAVKYGTGDVRVSLDAGPGGSHVLTVSNAGPAMPEGYDPASSKGLGMKIIQSFARKIGGKLIFARDNGDQGARISVVFS